MVSKSPLGSFTLRGKRSLMSSGSEANRSGGSIRCESPEFAHNFFSPGLLIRPPRCRLPTGVSTREHLSHQYANPVLISTPCQADEETSSRAISSADEGVEGLAIRSATLTAHVAWTPARHAIAPIQSHRSGSRRNPLTCATAKSVSPKGGPRGTHVE